MKMGDPLLFIYLLFLSCSLHFPLASSTPTHSPPPSYPLYLFSLTTSISYRLTVLPRYIVSASHSFSTTLIQGQVWCNYEQQPLFPCQTSFCLPFCPCVLSPNSTLLRLQIGGCKTTNVTGAALRGEDEFISTHPPVPVTKKTKTQQ